MVEELVGVADAARRLGLTSQRVRQLAKAGQLPPPAGRIGRQDVWRWRDVAVWAAATGRLPAEEAKGRQSVRAWLPGQHAARVKVLDAVERWGDGVGTVHARIWDAAGNPREPPVVILGNLDDNSGQSVTNCIEDVAMEVGARHLGPRALEAQFYDHWSSAEPAQQFHHVTFTVQPGAPRSAWRQTDRRASEDAARLLGASLTRPEWRAAPRAEVEALTGGPVEVWIPGTYTAAMVTAVADSPDGRVGAVWDPASSIATAAAALAVDGDRPEQRAAAAAAARYALEQAALAAAAVASQAADAPVWLAAAEPQDRERLERTAATVAAGNHDRLWEALAWVRGRLRETDLAERISLVPSVRRPGWSRLLWHEAGVEEPVDPRVGALGPVVLPEDLLEAAVARRPPRSPDDGLRLVERALTALLTRDCRAYETWDVPASRPAGPFRAAGPTVTRYLAQLAWSPAADHDPDRTARLASRLGFATGADAATDPDGNLVLRSADRRTFALEWPAVHARRADELARAVVRADPSRRTGALPVFLALPDASLVPLPSEPSWRATHNYTWGYPGTGPDNLARAVLHAVRCASGGPEDGDFPTRAGAAIHDLVRSGAPPSWPLHDVILAAGGTSAGAR